MAMEQKLLLVYNIKPNREAEYYRYVLGEFLPALQNMGLMMVEGWHTAYGNYPMRLLVFRSENDVDLRTVLQKEQWQDARQKLMGLIRSYEEKVVPARNTFQFFLPTDQEKK
ncbi:hypothetical protein QUF64_04785 [Anaerolineales bacterium HSG6]|nr:hypothetical protein [Anaerolineales bacterium HSG6]MDM8533012.1 hypothetical protein [Anaerolineales bacterium HSG25]